jgi:hypothetical protein
MFGVFTQTLTVAVPFGGSGTARVSKRSKSGVFAQILTAHLQKNGPVEETFTGPYEGRRTTEPNLG